MDYINKCATEKSQVVTHADQHILLFNTLLSKHVINGDIRGAFTNNQTEALENEDAESSDFEYSDSEDDSNSFN